MVMKSKKAQNMSLTTILIMVIGIVVVALLIWGFSSGWTGFWEKLGLYASKPNVDSVKSACNLACASGSSSQFCEEVRNVINADLTKTKGSCETLSFVDRCSAVTCKPTELPKKCEDSDTIGLGAKWESKCTEGRIDRTSKVGDWENKDHSKEKCCAMVAPTGEGDVIPQATPAEPVAPPAQ